MQYTKEIDFFNGNNPKTLIEEYGSPLYVYNEKLLRQSCNDLKNLSTSKQFYVNYSAKANTNLELLKIIHSEGLIVDAMSPGELYINKLAGFKESEILYVCNNVSYDELKNAIENNLLISVDSLSQLETLGKVMQETTGSSHKVLIRVNLGKGAGHHEKVITAGKETKFGINPEYMEEVYSLLRKYNLTLVGINQHIGSLFMNADDYIEAMKMLLNFVSTLPTFKDIEIIDFGGGFGIPYRKYAKEERLDMNKLSQLIDKVISEFSQKFAYTGKYYIEPGRYVVAESSVLLGTVNAVKQNADTHYIGTDIGFNVLQRPAMYDSHHDVELYQEEKSAEIQEQTVVGNICESGDILAKKRMLPKANVGDIVGVLDAGAYGFSMSSSYNQRLRPAEVLIKADNTVQLIRRRETIEDLTRYFI